MNAFEAGVIVGMEKAAAGPQVYHEPGALASGFAGRWLPHETMVDQRNKAVADKVKYKGKGGLLALPPKKDFVAQYGEQGEDAYRAMRGHEMMHWMRHKKGKMKRFGQPGVRGLATTAREELLGYLRGASKAKNPKTQMRLAKRMIPDTAVSVRDVYKGQRLRDVATGGKLGRALKKLVRR